MRALEHFQAKWTPVRVKKMRRNKDLEPRSDSIGTEKALSLRVCPGNAATLFRPRRVLISYFEPILINLNSPSDCTTREPSASSILGGFLEPIVPYSPDAYTLAVRHSSAE